MEQVQIGLSVDTSRGDASIEASAKRARELFEKKGVKLNLKSPDLPLGRISGDFNKFSDSLDAATSRVLAFTATTTAIYGVAKAITGLFTESVKLEKQLASIQSILQTSSSNLESFKNELFSIANATGQSFDTAAAAAEEFARQGLSVQETAKATASALAFSKIAGVDAAKSVETLTASLNTFNNEALDYTDIVDTITTLDTNFAISAAGIADGLKRIGSVASEAGIDLKEIASLISVVQQVSARGAPVISNGLKTIFTRLNRSSVQEALQGLGVETQDSSGQFRSQIDVLTDLANIFDTLSDSQRAYISEQVAGVYQINTLQATLKTLTGEYSLYDKAVRVASDSSGSAAERLEILTKTTDANLQTLKNNVTQFLAETGKVTVKPILDNFVGLGNSIFEVLNKTLFSNKDTGEPDTFGETMGKGILKGISAVLQGPGTILLITTVARLLANLAKDALKAISVLSGLKKASLSDSEAQRSVNSAIANGNKLLVERLRTTTDIVARTQILNKLLADQTNRQAASQINSLVNTGLAKNPRKGKASGFIPNFSEAAAPSITKSTVSAAESFFEAQGALDHGYKPGKVYSTRIHDGNGKSEMSVVNSAEKVVNFVNDRGKKATMVIPPNGFGRDTQYAARGFVPNFAPAIRRIGILDADILDNPQYADIVRAQMANLQVSRIYEYYEELGQLAIKKRDSGGLKKVKTIYGTAGSGKTSLAFNLDKFGNPRQSDDSRLRKTIRIPIIQPSDIDKVDEVIATKASITTTETSLRNPSGFLGNVNSYRSLNTPKEVVEKNRENRMAGAKEGPTIASQGRSPSDLKRVSREVPSEFDPYIPLVAKDVWQQKYNTWEENFKVDNPNVSPEEFKKAKKDRLSKFPPPRVIKQSLDKEGNLKRSVDRNPYDIVSRKIAFAYGAFAPFTKGHEKMFEQAKSLGFQPKDIVFGVSAGAEIDPDDDHSLRTTYFPADFRMEAIKRGTGASTAYIDKNFKGSVPSILKLSDGTFVKPAPGSIALTGDDKNLKETEKYKKIGLETVQGPRTKGVSGTELREAIKKGDIAKIKELSGSADFIIKNIDIIGNRINLLDEIKRRKKIKLNERLSPILNELETLPKRLTDKTSSDDREKVLALRKQRDRLKAAFAPEIQAVMKKAEGIVPGLKFDYNSLDIGQFLSNENPYAQQQFELSQASGNKNVESDDKISTIGFKQVEVKIPDKEGKRRDLTSSILKQPAASYRFKSKERVGAVKTPNDYTGVFERYAIQQANKTKSGPKFIPTRSVAFGKGNAAVDAFSIDSVKDKKISLLEAKAGDWTANEAGNKFGRFLPENLIALSPLLLPLFTEGVQNKYDRIQLTNYVAVPDLSSIPAKEKEKVRAGAIRERTGGKTGQFFTPETINPLSRVGNVGKPATRNVAEPVTIGGSSFAGKSDTELAEIAQGGDEAARNEILKRYASGKIRGPRRGLRSSGFIPNFLEAAAPVVPVSSTVSPVESFFETQGALDHGYKPGKVYSTRIHDGNGKSEMSVVNSAERVVNFVNDKGKRATMVVPPNGFGRDTQYAARGFVPNFAQNKTFTPSKVVLRDNGIYDGDSLQINFTPAAEPVQITSRLLGADAFELNTGSESDKQKGRKAKELLKTHMRKRFGSISEGTDVTELFKAAGMSQKEKYGRPFHKDDNYVAKLKASGYEKNTPIKSSEVKSKNKSLNKGFIPNFSPFSEIKKQFSIDRGLEGVSSLTYTRNEDSIKLGSVSSYRSGDAKTLIEKLLEVSSRSGRPVPVEMGTFLPQEGLLDAGKKRGYSGFKLLKTVFPQIKMMKQIKGAVGSGLLFGSKGGDKMNFKFSSLEELEQLANTLDQVDEKTSIHDLKVRYVGNKEDLIQSNRDDRKKRILNNQPTPKLSSYSQGFVPNFETDIPILRDIIKFNRGQFPSKSIPLFRGTSKKREPFQQYDYNSVIKDSSPQDIFNKNSLEQIITNHRNRPLGNAFKDIKRINESSFKTSEEKKSETEGVRENFRGSLPFISTSKDEDVAKSFTINKKDDDKLVAKKDFRTSRIITADSYRVLVNKYGEAKVKDVLFKLTKINKGKGIGFDFNSFQGYSFGEEKEVGLLNKGFVPNFNFAIKEAKNREMMAGYSMGEVKVGKDKSLISPLNPEGFGVFNRDEGSLKNGINLAKKAGIDPITKGMAAKGFVPNFNKINDLDIRDKGVMASGFVPNFAKIPRVGSRRPSRRADVDKDTKPDEDTETNEGKPTSKTDREGLDLTNILFSLSSLLSFSEGFFRSTQEEPTDTDKLVSNAASSVATGLSAGTLAGSFLPKGKVRGIGSLIAGLSAAAFQFSKQKKLDDIKSRTPKLEKELSQFQTKAELETGNTQAAVEAKAQLEALKDSDASVEQIARAQVKFNEALSKVTNQPVLQALTSSTSKPDDIQDISLKEAQKSQRNLEIGKASVVISNLRDTSLKENKKSIDSKNAGAIASLLASTIEINNDPELISSLESLSKREISTQDFFSKNAEKLGFNQEQVQTLVEQLNNLDKAAAGSSDQIGSLFAALTKNTTDYTKALTREKKLPKALADLPKILDLASRGVSSQFQQKQVRESIRSKSDFSIREQNLNFAEKDRNADPFKLIQESSQLNLDRNKKESDLEVSSSILEAVNGLESLKPKNLNEEQSKEFLKLKEGVLSGQNSIEDLGKFLSQNSKGEDSKNIEKAIRSTSAELALRLVSIDETFKTKTNELINLNKLQIEAAKKELDSTVAGNVFSGKTTEALDFLKGFDYAGLRKMQEKEAKLREEASKATGPRKNKLLEEADTLAIDIATLQNQVSEAERTTTGKTSGVFKPDEAKLRENLTRQTTSAQGIGMLRGVTDSFYGRKIFEEREISQFERSAESGDLAGAQKVLDEKIANRPFLPSDVKSQIDKIRELLQARARPEGSEVSAPSLDQPRAIEAIAAENKLAEASRRYIQEESSPEVQEKEKERKIVEDKKTKADVEYLAASNEQRAKIERGEKPTAEETLKLDSLRKSSEDLGKQFDTLVDTIDRLNKSRIDQGNAILNPAAVAGGAFAGFVPNFASARSNYSKKSIDNFLEVRGALNHGYTPGKVFSTRIHDGNGNSRIATVNSAEKITNFVNSEGNKATLVTPPNGFGENTQYASSGFIPNFAKRRGRRGRGKRNAGAGAAGKRVILPMGPRMPGIGVISPAGAGAAGKGVISPAGAGAAGRGVIPPVGPSAAGKSLFSKEIAMIRRGFDSLTEQRSMFGKNKFGNVLNSTPSELVSKGVGKLAGTKAGQLAGELTGKIAAQVKTPAPLLTAGGTYIPAVPQPTPPTAGTKAGQLAGKVAGSKAGQFAGKAGRFVGRKLLGGLAAYYSAKEIYDLEQERKASGKSYTLFSGEEVSLNERYADAGAGVLSLVSLPAYGLYQFGKNIKNPLGQRGGYGAYDMSLGDQIEAFRDDPAEVEEAVKNYGKIDKGGYGGYETGGRIRSVAVERALAQEGFNRIVNKEVIQSVLIARNNFGPKNYSSEEYQKTKAAWWLPFYNPEKEAVQWKQTNREEFLKNIEITAKLAGMKPERLAKLAFLEESEARSLLPSAEVKSLEIREPNEIFAKYEDASKKQNEQRGQTKKEKIDPKKSRGRRRHIDRTIAFLKQSGNLSYLGIKDREEKINAWVNGDDSVLRGEKNIQFRDLVAGSPSVFDPGKRDTGSVKMRSYVDQGNIAEITKEAYGEIDRKSNLKEDKSTYTDADYLPREELAKIILNDDPLFKIKTGEEVSKEKKQRVSELRDALMEWVKADGAAAERITKLYPEIRQAVIRQLNIDPSKSSTSDSSPVELAVQSGKLRKYLNNYDQLINRLIPLRSQTAMDSSNILKTYDARTKQIDSPIITQILEDVFAPSYAQEDVVTRDIFDATNDKVRDKTAPYKVGVNSIIKSSLTGGDYDRELAAQFTKEKALKQLDPKDPNASFLEKFANPDLDTETIFDQMQKEGAFDSKKLMSNFKAIWETYKNRIQQEYSSKVPTETNQSKPSESSPPQSSFGVPESTASSIPASTSATPSVSPPSKPAPTASSLPSPPPSPQAPKVEPPKNLADTFSNDGADNLALRALLQKRLEASPGFDKFYTPEIDSINNYSGKNKAQSEIQNLKTLRAQKTNPQEIAEIDEQIKQYELDFQSIEADGNSKKPFAKYSQIMPQWVKGDDLAMQGAGSQWVRTPLISLINSFNEADRERFKNIQDKLKASQSVSKAYSSELSSKNSSSALTRESFDRVKGIVSEGTYELLNGEEQKAFDKRQEGFDRKAVANFIKKENPLYRKPEVGTMRSPTEEADYKERVQILDLWASGDDSDLQERPDVRAAISAAMRASGNKKGFSSGFIPNFAPKINLELLNRIASASSNAKTDIAELKDGKNPKNLGVGLAGLGLDVLEYSPSGPISGSASLAKQAMSEDGIQYNSNSIDAGINISTILPALAGMAALSKKVNLKKSKTLGPLLLGALAFKTGMNIKNPLGRTGGFGAYDMNLGDLEAAAKENEAASVEATALSSKLNEKLYIQQVLNQNAKRGDFYLPEPNADGGVKWKKVSKVDFAKLAPQNLEALGIKFNSSYLQPSNNFAGFIPNFASYKKSVMRLEENMSGEKAIFSRFPFPHIRNQSQPTFNSAISDHGGLNNALSDSIAGQQSASLMSRGFIPNFVQAGARKKAIESANVTEQSSGQRASTKDDSGSQFSEIANSLKSLISEIGKISESLNKQSSDQSNTTKSSSEQKVDIKIQVDGTSLTSEQLQKVKSEMMAILENKLSNINKITPPSRQV